MKGTMVDEDTKRGTIAMLKRVQQQQQAEEADAATEYEATVGSEGESKEEMARLMAAVDDDTITLSSLSPEQQRLFLRALHDGTLSRHIPIAVPWWLPQRGRRQNEAGQPQETSDWEPELEKILVKETEQTQSDEAQQTRAFIQSLPPLPSILTTEPSPALPYHVMELAYGFCYLFRLYNCEPDTDLSAFLNDLITLVPSLTPTSTCAAHYQSTATTLQSCVARTRSLPSLFQSPRFSTLVIRDCSQLCLNTPLLFRLLRETSVWFSSGGGGSGSGMRRVGRKLWFLCVWLQDSGVDVMRRVGEEARLVWLAEKASTPAAANS